MNEARILDAGFFVGFPSSIAGSWERACPAIEPEPTAPKSQAKKGAPTKRPTSRVAHNEICQSSNAIASALHASIRAQSPFLIQLLSSIQVPPTHITLGRAM